MKTTLTDTLALGVLGLGTLLGAASLPAAEVLALEAAPTAQPLSVLSPNLDAALEDRSKETIAPAQAVYPAAVAETVIGSSMRLQAIAPTAAAAAAPITAAAGQTLLLIAAAPPDAQMPGGRFLALPWGS